MSAPAGEVSGPRWLQWLFLPLLVLPFHPYWADFEQVRRGLLLVLAGVCLVGCRSLRPVRGERLWLALLGWLFLSAVVNFVAQGVARNADTTPSFQSWEAVYRLAHWAALGVVLRLGAASPFGFSGPCAGVLVATSLFGLLQRIGLGEIGGYGVEREPVSVFGNLNVASEFTAVAATVVAASCPFSGGSAARRWLSRVAMVCAGAYLVVNHSRSGLVALPLGLLLLWRLRWRYRGWLPLAFALAGAACGLVLDAAVASPAPASPAEATAARQQPTATLDVRREIYMSTAFLIAERVVLGHGPGQFAVQYPRWRSQVEIDASSHGRQFATEVRTAHDDWLELLVDGGLPALVIFLIALRALYSGMSDKARLLPLFVLLLLMFVRSPLGNAPAVAAALLLVGDPVTSSAVAGWRRLVAAGLGLLLLALGVVPIAANCLFVPYQSARAYGDSPKPDAIAAAAAWMPFEPRWQQLLAQEQLAAGDFANAARTAARALRLRPYEPQFYLLLGEVLARGSKYEEAVLVARHGLQFDPPNPELRVLLSTVLAQQGKPDEAILAVVGTTRPMERLHPTLRAQLGAHFQSLAKLASDHGNQQLAARFAVEQHFVGAIESLSDRSPAALAATQAHLDAMRAAMQAAGLTRKDLRFYVVSALYAIDLERPELAIQAGEGAKALDLPLPVWQGNLLGKKLRSLERIEVWADVLARH